MIGGEVALESGQVSVSERDGVIRIAILRTGDLSTTATIEFGVTNEGAEDGAGGDYQLAAAPDVTATGPLSGVVTLAPGQSRGEIAFTINDDAASESTETFVVSIVNVDGTTLTAPRTTRVDILDDENPVTDPPVPPLESPFEVTLDPVVTGLTQPISFDYSTVDPSVLFVAEKRGVVKAFDMSAIDAGGAAIELGTVLDIQSITNNRQDRGLLDIELHPDLENFPYLYAFVVIDPPAEIDPATGDVIQPGVDAFSGNAGANGGGNRFSHLIRYTLDEATGYTTIVDGSAEVILGGGAQYLSDISGDGAIDSTSPSSLDTVAATPTDVLDFSDPADPVFKDDVLKVDSRSHAGGALAFGPDGALYVSTGDGTSFNFADPRSFYVQDVDSLAGKILRIDPITGEGLADNPFVEPGDDLSANRSKVYQLGLRNPFSMGFDDDGDLLITDTGWNSWEEINSGGPGANFGWPFYEGGDNGVLVLNNQYANRPEVQDGTFAIPPESEVTPAFRAFSHSNGQAGFQVQAITGGDAFYDGDKYPAALQGAYFFADVSQGEVFAVNEDDRRDITFLLKREGGLAPVHFSQGPDGYVYYADLAFGTIGRLEIVEPVAQIALEPLADVVEADQDPATDTETTTPYTFAARLSSPVAGLVSVDYVASAGAFSVSGALTFDPEATTPLRAAATIDLPADAVATSDQVLTITLSNIVVGPNVDPARVAFDGGEATVSDAATIFEDDAPRLSLSAPGDVDEGDSGAGTLIFTAALSAPAGPGGVTADVSVSGGAGFAPASIVIAEGALSAEITVAFTGDAVVELDEAVTVTLSNVTNALEGALSAVATIRDDDFPTLTLIGDASLDDATGEYVLTTASNNQTGAVALPDRIDLSQAATIAFDINMGANDGGADGGAFWIHNAPDGVSTIGATGGGLGASGVENAVGIEFDTYQNGGEPAADHTAFFDPDGGGLSTPVELGDIEDGVWRSVRVDWDPTGGDGDGALSYSIDGAPVGVLEGDIRADYLGGSDFGYFAFSAATGGLNNVQKVRFTGLDATFEGAPGDDPTPPVLTLSSPGDALEGGPGDAGSLVFTATLDKPAGPGGVAANIAVSGGDDVSPSALLIPEGALSAEIAVQFAGDADVEPDETVTVTLTDIQNATAGVVAASATILDDDEDGGGGPVTVLADETFETGAASGWSATTTTDGGAAFSTFLGRFSGAGVAAEKTFTPPTGADRLVIEFDYLEIDSWDGDQGDAMLVTVNGTEIVRKALYHVGRAGESGADPATSGVTDGVAWSVTPLTSGLDGLGFASQSYASDQIHRVVLTIDNPAGPVTLGVGATLDQGLGDESYGLDNVLVTAFTDDVTPPPLLSLSPPADAVEGGVGETGTLTFLATLDQPSATGDVVAAVAIAGNAAGPASVTIPQGQTNAEIVLSFVGDALDEPDETLTVTLSDLTGAEPGAALSASARVLDDDAPRLSLSPATDAVEGGVGETGTLTFLATLDQPSATGDVVAAVAIAGNATGPASVTIPQGQTSAEIVLSFDGDALDEPDETITVTLSDLTGAEPGAALSASAQILDDDAPDAPTAAQLEFGRVTVEQPTGDDWFSVSFTETIDNAVVVMGPLTDNGGQPAFARIRNVTEDGFEYQIEEWSYLDGFHVAETIGWMAMSEGAYALEDGRVIVAGETRADTTFTSVDLTGFDAAPIVLTQQIDAVDAAPAVTRIQNVSATGFEVKLREEEAADNAHAEEAIGYIAIEAGVGAGVTAAATPDAVTHQTYAVAIDDATLDSFVFLAGMQTNDGNDTAALRYDATATGVDLFVDEEQSRDSETNHTSEVVGYLAATEGLFTLTPEDDALI